MSNHPFYAEQLKALCSFQTGGQQRTSSESDLMGLSTHILDTALGRPAVEVELLLAKHRGGTWIPLARGKTDSDGRCRTLLGEHEMESAIYKLTFFTGPYYMSQKLVGLYPFVDIVFEVHDPGAHYHIPLLLTANGYTTYRGS